MEVINLSNWPLISVSTGKYLKMANGWVFKIQCSSVGKPPTIPVENGRLANVVRKMQVPLEELGIARVIVGPKIRQTQILHFIQKAGPCVETSVKNAAVQQIVEPFGRLKSRFKKSHFIEQLETRDLYLIGPFYVAPSTQHIPLVEESVK